MHADVKAAMEPYFSEVFYNPSATYNAGRQAKQALEAARAEVAGVLGAKPSEIIFTAGGTEANNLAIHGILHKHEDAELLVSAVEHESVLQPAREHVHQEIVVDAKGQINLQDLQSKINEHTVLISVMYANNEVGTIQPLRKVVQLAEETRKQRRKRGVVTPLYVHTDACQASNYLDLHVSRLGVDLMTLNGGKIYGPKQSGVLFVASHVVLKPQITGGGQERGLRSGTENVAGAVGFARALELAQVNRHDNLRSMYQLQQQFIQAIEQVLPNTVLNGSTKHRLPNNIHLTLPGQDNERLLFALDERGIMAAAGSACSASDDEPSHVLRAMGISEADAQASLRFTMGSGTTEQAIDQTVKTLADILSTT